MMPNSTELAILKLLWQKEPRTAREIHQSIEPLFGWTYSSTRKTLERMGNKGILEVGDQGNKKSFKAKLEKVPTLAAYMQNFAANVLELNEPLPVAMLADSRLLKPEELGQLEQVLKQLADTDGAEEQ